MVAAWTDDRKDILVRLWNDGQSAAYIASVLGGVTRSAVCGKADRLRRTTDLIKRQPVNDAQIYGVKEIRFTSVRNEERVKNYTTAGNNVVAKFDARMSNTGIPLLEIKGRQCRFPTGNGPDWLMCGEPTKIGNYCLSCAKRAFGRAA